LEELSSNSAEDEDEGEETSGGGGGREGHDEGQPKLVLSTGDAPKITVLTAKQEDDEYEVLFYKII
jgi:hypothetical protein